jgi:3-phenylpropionate/trans-cinnamate dioxygenase ferredoxin component
MGWVRACRVDELPPGEASKMDVDPPVAVFNLDGEFYATDDTCSHAQSSLSEGYLEGDEIECVWHYARFCVRTGKAMCLPATEDLKTYEVRVDGNVVLVDIPGS